MPAHPARYQQCRALSHMSPWGYQLREESAASCQHWRATIEDVVCATAGVAQLDLSYEERESMTAHQRRTNLTVSEFGSHLQPKCGDAWARHLGPFSALRRLHRMLLAALAWEHLTHHVLPPRRDAQQQLWDMVHDWSSKGQLHVE